MGLVCFQIGTYLVERSCSNIVDVAIVLRQISIYQVVAVEVAVAGVEWFDIELVDPLGFIVI